MHWPHIKGLSYECANIQLIKPLSASRDSIGNPARDSIAFTAVNFGCRYSALDFGLMDPADATASQQRKTVGTTKKQFLHLWQKPA